MTTSIFGGRPALVLPMLLLAVAVAAGCSTSHPRGDLVDAQGNHPANFLATHPTFASPDASACVSCHGDNLQGGISGVSCFTASFEGQGCHAAGPTPANHQPIATWVNAHQGEAAAVRPGFDGCNATMCHGATLQGGPAPSCFTADFAGFLCHAGGPPPDFHPAGWFVDHRAFAATNGTASCEDAACHGATLHADPPGATGPSCFRAAWGALACHAGGPGTGGANHAVPFFDNATHFQVAQATFNADCATCHALTGTSPNPDAPVCSVCHTNTAVNPLVTKNCTSCHAVPPAGAAYPNIAGAHALYLFLNSAGTPVTCDTCHNGLSGGTLAHYNAANARAGGFLSPGTVAIVGTYTAQSGGAASFNDVALTCANVSCHGGQVTPNWRTGTIDPATDCESCHQFDVAQFNSYFSGQHDSGGHNGEFCTACHDPALLAPGHFANLQTSTFEQAPAATLRPALQYNGTTCNPAAGGLTGCHGEQDW